MGSTFSSPGVTEDRSHGTKRPNLQSDIDARNQSEDENLRTPKRKRLKSTSSYIFNTLFINGESSDVIIEACGKQWKLHRVYLGQCKYFTAMFGGSWKESKSSVIHMDIPDDNINSSALDIAFGSLYKDDVLIEPIEVSSVLAASMLLGLDGLICQCVEIMLENISGKTVCSYHDTALLYGQQDVQDRCLKWLETNIMTTPSVDLLKEINIDLMTRLVASCKLFVMQVEMDVYSLLKKWLFLKLNKEWLGTWKEVSSSSEDFYISKASNSPFLDETECKTFKKVFRMIRFQHIITDSSSTKMLEDDNIIPKGWLSPIFRLHWQQMLRIEQSSDKGPESMTECVFNKLSTRCGRYLLKDGEYCWRWTGYNYGVDLIISLSNKLITFKRNAHSQPCAGSVNMQHSRSFMYRISAVSLNTLGQVKYIKESPIETILLTKDEEVAVLHLEAAACFPLHISINYLFYTPTKETLDWLESQDQLEETEENNHELLSTKNNLSPLNAGPTDIVFSQPNLADSCRRSLTKEFDEDH